MDVARSSRSRRWKWADIDYQRYVPAAEKQHSPHRHRKSFDRHRSATPSKSSPPKSPPVASRTTSAGCGWRPGTARITSWSSAPPGNRHFDGLIEGTPARRRRRSDHPQADPRRAARRCDLIEDEVGRPINFHSYVSGVAGPEIAVLFAEEGVNGAHQDPQYNVLYRNINMVPLASSTRPKPRRSWPRGNLLQIDGAHNANATAKAGLEGHARTDGPARASTARFPIAAGMKQETDRAVDGSADGVAGARI
ncbi:MAG: lysine 5,6-aminomutase subunit alpha [Bacillus subtilis]|nr:lysine 5,6-aminomutase subunit alpha [Bacillus subtilis]